MFNRSWNELAKHERMYIWVRRHYPIMLEFERPLTLDNCRSITDRITDWHDVERLMESIANRRNVLTAHTSAIATTVLPGWMLYCNESRRYDRTVRHNMPNC